jgi:hypothetical protein
VVLRAIEAHGGWPAWMAARSIEYDWESGDLGADKTLQRSRVKFDLHGGRVRIEAAGSGVTQIWDGREAWTHPPDAKLELPARFITRTEHYWFALPWKLADPGANLELLEDETRNGRRFRRVKVTYAPEVGDSSKDWYVYHFDAETGLLAGTLFIVTFFGLEPGQTDYPPYYGEWDEYVSAGGLRIASRRRFGPWKDGAPGEFVFFDLLQNIQAGAQPLPEETFQPL